MKKSDATHRLVKEAYGGLVRTGCCGGLKPSCCGEPAAAADQPVPEAELGLSCGDPVAFSHLRPGDVVLDLGSGGGKDVFLAARKVGPSGRAIGVDMTPEMLHLAERNAEKFRDATGLSNVAFRQGTIERLPLEDASVDVVISNCVINLSPDKPQVFREAFRVLKPAGRMIVSDIVLLKPLPAKLRKSPGLYVACVAGALQREDYLGAIRSAGFTRVEVLSERAYAASNAASDPVTRGVADSLSGAAASLTILGRKPATRRG